MAGFLLAICGTVTALAGDTALRDPTQPPSASLATGQAVEQQAPPRVSAIFIGPGGGHAIVDGRTVKAGDAWDGMEVLAVEPGLVRIRRDGTTTELRLLGIPVRRDNEVRR